jgi:choline dehydrogenase-like flavoprotein
MRAPAGDTFDLIIVGGGTAGALLARGIAGRVPASILVLESGPRYPRLALSTPLASYRLSRPWSWGFESVPQPELSGRRIRYPMGRVLGGSSSVNAMIAAHGHASDYDAWAAAGCDGWDWSAVSSVWARATDTQREGAVPVGLPSFTAPFTSALIDACVESGLSRVDALTGERSGTCGTFALFQRRGARYSTAETLASVASRGTVMVMPRTTVRRVIVERDVATGVECTGAYEGILSARYGVVLCAGVFGSPSILLRSGIGPAVRLREAGITPQCELPGVGENLHDHVGVPVIWCSHAPSPGRKSRWIPAALRYVLGGAGVMASNGCEGGAFLGAPGRSPDIEIAARFQSQLRSRAVEMSAIVMHPASRGTVTIDPADPFGAPLIDPGFLSACGDADRLQEGIKRIREIAARPSLRSFGLAEELMPGSADVAAHIRAHASTHFHPVGTCRMGIDEMAVVSPQLAVRGVRSLWVCDNSIIPSIPAGHSAATAMIIGERGAGLIAEQVAAP